MGKLSEKCLQGFDFLDNKLHEKKWYFVFYTIIFAITALLVFSQFMIQGRGFIWRTDGQPQHFNALLYYGTYLRNIVRELLQGRITVPLWDFSFGFGADVLVTLHYYVIGDPLTLLSVFVPTRYMEHFYNFLVVFRLYLAGLAFSLYAFKFKKQSWPVLIGALIYVFCGFALFAGPRHPFFLNPFIYFPLICLGVEKIFRKEKPYIFILMVFISLASNFYFFYMISVLVFVYAWVRFFFIYDRFSFKQLGQDLGKFVFYFLIGVLMAGIIAFPNIYTVFASNRSSIARDIPLFFAPQHYRNLIFYFMSYHRIGAWIYLGFAAISVIAILYLILSVKKNKSYRQLAIGFVILTVLLLFPIFGHMMNGFAQILNRWIWGYSFLIAFIVTTTTPELVNICRKKLAIISLLVVAYFLGFIFVYNAQTINDLVFAVILLMTLAALVVVSLLKIKNHFKYMIVLLVVIFNISALAYFLYSPRDRNYAAEFNRFGTTFVNLRRSGSSSIDNSDMNDFFRVEEGVWNSGYIYNSVVQTGVNGSSFYWSLATPYVGQFLNEIHHWAERDFQFSGLDGRAMLGALVSNRYFVVREGNEAFIPYGYFEEPVGQARVAGDSNRTHYAFLNQYALPLGYTYRYYMTRSQFDQLTFIERQQAMMQAVLLEERDSHPDFPVRFNHEILNFEVEVGDGITFEDGRIVTTKRNAELTFTFTGLPNSELYVNFNEIHFDGNVARTLINASNGYLTKNFGLATPYWYFYGERHNFALNLSHTEEAINQITVWFRNVGTYTFDSIEIIAQPMDYFAGMVAELNEYTLENVMMSNNRIDGTIDVSEDRILVFSIPFSSGWRAYINGERTELTRANTMFMAIEVPAGSHEITLRYFTPFLAEGIIATISGFGLFGGVIVYLRLKKSPFQET